MKGKVNAQGRLVWGSDVEWFVGCKGPVAAITPAQIMLRPVRLRSTLRGAGCVVAAPSLLSGRRADDHRYPPPLLLFLFIPPLAYFYYHSQIVRVFFFFFFFHPSFFPLIFLFFFFWPRQLLNSIHILSIDQETNEWFHLQILQCQVPPESRSLTSWSLS